MCEVGEEGTTCHELINCDYVAEVGGWLLASLRHHLGTPNITATDIVNLNLGDIELSMRLPAVWIISKTLSYIWHLRKQNKSVKLQITRAELEANINFFRQSKYFSSAPMVNIIIDYNFSVL